MTEEMKNTETAGAENTVSDPAAELQNMSFEDALAKLESIVRELESGRIKLDDAVAAYEKAVALKKLCSDRLAAAALKVEKSKSAKTALCPRYRWIMRRVDRFAASLVRKTFSSHNKKGKCLKS